MNLKEFIETISRNLRYEWWRQIGSWPMSQILYMKYWGKPSRRKTVVISNQPFISGR